MHLISSRGQEWAEQEVLVESSPTIMYQEVSGGREEQQTTGGHRLQWKPPALLLFLLPAAQVTSACIRRACVFSEELRGFPLQQTAAGYLASNENK